MTTELDTWSRAVLDSLRELGASALAWEGWEHGPTQSGQPPDSPVAFISLVSPANAIQIGFSCTKEAGEAIARALLCLDDGEDVVGETLSDAMGEVVNILAGSVKRKMVATDDALALGLPMYVEGKVQSSRSSDVVTTPVKLGDVEAFAVVMRERRAA